MRLIDANALHNTILRDEKLDGKDVNWAVNRIISHILNAHTIKSTTVYEFKGCDNCELERPKGEWMNHGYDNEEDGLPEYVCPFCGKNVFENVYNYCPICGADMRGDENA